MNVWRHKFEHFFVTQHSSSAIESNSIYDLVNGVTWSYFLLVDNDSFPLSVGNILYSFAFW